MEEKENSNYFSEREKKSINKFKEARTVFFLPLSKFLMKLGLTANALSYLGLASLAGFIFFLFKDPVVASFFLLAHVLIDAFDGPLARLMKQDGDAGAFTDIICDHTGMAIVVVALIWAKLVDPIAASVYIYLYTILVIFVIVRNKMKIPAKLVVRTKYYVYILFGVYAFFHFNFLDAGLLIFSALMLPSVLTSYFIIKKNLA